MTAPTYDLGTLHGGLRLPAHKSASTAQAVYEVPVPATLVLPLAQHVGEPAHPIVGIGEHVLKGQLIAEQEGSLGAPIHASSSGKIVAIERWPIWANSAVVVRWYPNSLNTSQTMGNSLLRCSSIWLGRGTRIPLQFGK